MPAHSHTFTWSGSHSHSRGTMNIVGSISGLGVTMGASGACYVSSAYSGANPRITSDSDARTITFNASRNWTGKTSSETISVSGVTSVSGSSTAFSILPPFVVKYCWERTA